MFDPLSSVSGGSEFPDPPTGDRVDPGAVEFGDDVDDELDAAVFGEDGWFPSAADEAELAALAVVVDAVRVAADAARDLDGDRSDVAVRFLRDLDPGPVLAAVLAGVGPTSLSDRALVDYVRAVERQRRHLDGVMAAAVARLARRDVFARCADPGELGERVHGPAGHDFRAAAADELSPALSWTTRYATGQVELAVELAELLPATLAALTADRIDGYKARIIRDATACLADRPALRATVEAAALAVAAAKTAPALRAFIQRRVIAADPDSAERRRRTASRSRGVGRPVPDPDGMACVSVYGPLVVLAAFWTALDAAARARQQAAATDASHPDAGQSLDALRFDVLADLAYTALSVGHLGCCNPDCAGSCQRLGARHGREAHITVRMGAGTAAGLDNLPAELVGFGPITADAARAFAADATWRRLLTDPVTGALLDYGRTTYQPPQPLREFVIARDGTCRFPTCTWPAAAADLDHQPAWNDGGQTNPDGIIALHRRHHNDKTHHGCRIDQPEPGVVIWVTATGHHYRIDPDIVDMIIALGDSAPQHSGDPPAEPDPPPF